MDKSLIGYSLIVNIPMFATDEEELEFEKLGENFRALMWGNNSFSSITKALSHNHYGKSLRLILLVFQLFADKSDQQKRNPVDYRPREKAMSVDIFLNRDFFDLTQQQQQQQEHIKDSIIRTLQDAFLDKQVKKVDTNFPLLVEDLKKSLGR